MSYHSPKTPSVVPSAQATSPKYSTSGIGNEIEASKKKQGFLSTFFGRSTTGIANMYSMRRDNNMLNSYFSQFKKQ